MAERIAHRELRNHSGEVLRAVARGATYEVTNHGHVVAVIAPPGARPGNLEVIPASKPGEWQGLPLHQIDESTEAVLDELRADTT